MHEQSVLTGGIQRGIYIPRSLNLLCKYPSVYRFGAANLAPQEPVPVMGEIPLQRSVWSVRVA